MDLSTTRTIKRRVITIEPDQTRELTDCTITLSNWLQSVDTESTKMRISSFYFNNSTIPCFVPQYISKILPTNFPINIPAISPIPVPPAPEYLPATTVLTPDILNYFVAVRRVSDGMVVTSYISMESDLSEYPSLRPLIHPTNTYEQYRNRYYWFFNTSKFCDIVADRINTILTGTTMGLAGNDCVITRSPQGYGLYIGSTPFFGAAAQYELQFSKSLIDLFQFKSVRSVNSTELRTIVFNNTTRTYGTPSIIGAYVASNYIPDSWFPFSQILIKSTLPVETEVFFDNKNYVSQNFQNILLAFGVNNSSPDAIYNFYKMTAGDGENWVSIVNTNSGENATIQILLEFRETGDLIPYTINKNEKFRMIIETIETD